MRVRLISIILLLSIILSACDRNSAGTGSKQKAPVLNENGKEEIALALTQVDEYFKKAIVDYNRQSDKYEIVLYEIPDGMIPIDARKRIQLDLANGKGPDILSDGALNECDMTPYAEDGYLMDLTDFVAGYEDLLDCVKDFNTMDGVVYGIPMAFELVTVAVSSNLDISKNSNTKERWIELTQDLDGNFGTGGYSVLEHLGVGVNGVQLFVDEEKGVSHFDKREYIDLLEFAKKYECFDNGMTLQERLISSYQLFLGCVIEEFDNFWFHEALFKETPSYIGFPTESGGKEIIRISSLYINSATEHEEGAKDFLRFILTEEQQRAIVDNYAGFSVREEVLRKIWQEAKDSPETGFINYTKGELLGVEFEPRVMRDEEEELFFSMLEGDLIYDYRASVISDIVYEETAPFFEGKKTAEEVARIIDNRVQLYLDEKK